MLKLILGLLHSVFRTRQALILENAALRHQIEGTQASLDDLLASEAEAPVDAPPEHVEEISNYLEALKYARG